MTPTTYHPHAEDVANAVLKAAGSGGLHNFMPYWREQILMAVTKALQSQEKH